jgi:hypothetical protein
MLLCATTLYGAEGMWMPQQIPLLAEQLKRNGMQIDPNRLADLTGDPMGAVVGLGGCSASFVSPDGLVVTNHHCAYGSLQFNSRPERDLLTNGFLAKTREEELPAAPGSRVFVTTNIEDVTARMNAAVNTRMSDYDRDVAIDKASKQLVEECEKPGGVRCRVAPFFEGAQYLRTTQMEVRDVRLVYAPAGGVGNFGGETDNWMWPRHTGDFSFLRAYVGKDGKPADYSKDNVPYRPAHWLKVATAGVQPGDMVFVAGYPGRTYRYRTAAEVGGMESFTYPTTNRYATDLNAILRDMGKNDKNVEILNASRIRGNDNLLKNYTGTLEGFRKDNIVGLRTDRETKLAAYIASHPEAKSYATALDQMNALQQRVASTRQRDTLLTWIYRASPMLNQAKSIYRLSIERPKADIDRKEGFQQRDWSRLGEASNRAQRTIEPKSDRAGLRYFLVESQKLPADQRIKPVDDAITRAGSIDTLLDQLYANTKVGDVNERKTMMGESTSQLSARHDAMLDLAASLSPLDLQVERTEREIAGAMSRIRPQYMNALRAMNGGVMYPDANGTLRLTFGRVEGYAPRDAVQYAPLTTVSGVVQKDTGSGEFNSPKSLLAAVRAKNFGPYADAKLGEVPVNFLSTCDTTGGNSGSPTFNARGELVGLLFDGNYESLGSDFVVDPKLTRSIHVDARYMLWVMDAIDGADNLLQEMGIAPKL